MKILCRRVVLLAGASIVTLGVADLALAETNVRPGIGHVDTSDPVDDNLVICIAHDSCEFGIETIETGIASAFVNNSATGRIEQFGTSLSSDVELAIENHGDARISARATALETGGLAQAESYVIGGVHQSGLAPDDLTLDLVNGGTLLVEALARANGGESGVGHAFASIQAGSQVAISTADGVAAVEIANSGSLQAVASATATGSATFASGTGSGTAPIVGADAVAKGFLQSVALAAEASLGAANSGSISVAASAVGEGAGVAHSHAAGSNGLLQQASAAVISETMANEGHISVAADAVAAAASASALANAYDAMGQYATGSAATQRMGNSGVVSIAADADALGDGLAIAGAQVWTAMYQQAAASSVVQTMTNSGIVSAIARAGAAADGVMVDDTGGAVKFGAAYVSASAVGLAQRGYAYNATQSLTNSGSINVGAEAIANAPAGTDPLASTASGFGRAFARGVGAHQGNNAAIAGISSFTNSGSIDVDVTASAAAAIGSATAVARGYHALADAYAPFAVAVANNGTIDVAANAVVPGSAYASAIGIFVDNRPEPDYLNGIPLSGTINNSGSIDVLASAAGETFTRVIGTGTTATTVTVGGSSAFASGIRVFGGVNNMTITNSGSINVDAVTADGGTAIAMGIVVLANGNVTPTQEDVLSITNSGDIIARQSANGGATFTRGLAINLAGNPDNGIAPAPNRSVINLRSGAIYGNIALRAAGGDQINVTNGLTSFDGIINPAFLPIDGISRADLDSGLSGAGALTIESGGTLFLRDNKLGGGTMYDGPSYALVERLDIGAAGTLAVELQPQDGGPQASGSYSQIFAESARLDGTFEARISTANGLFAENYSWNNVIDSSARSGTFDQCVMGGVYAGSVLLQLTCTYDAQANVDVGLTRVAFNEVAGLNRNAMSVARGLERIYDVGLTGGVRDLVSDLFFIGDRTQFNAALNQLAGTTYANYLQSFHSLGIRQVDMLDNSMMCESPLAGRSVLECRPGPIRVWGQADRQSRRLDGDMEAGSYDTDGWSLLIGADKSVGHAALIGASVGKLGNRLEDRRSHDDVKTDGYQVGLYGTFDPGAFYVKGFGTYSWFDGEARRRINLNPYGGRFAGATHGNPDVRMWSVGLHSGARFSIGSTAVVVPHLNLDHVDVEMDQFSEEGLPGADLLVGHAHERRTTLTGGVKLAWAIAGVMPQLELGYRHQFGDTRTHLSAAFNENTDSEFNVLSASEKRGHLLAGLSVGGRAGPVDVRLSYQGIFNGDLKSHAGNLKFVLPLGGQRAAPPPSETTE